ncbi:MAG: histidine--tRNA ligase [Flavobacteriales bacterium]|nr:histidine--tRNA ligase [Flavobacteriales bacterium]
MSPSLPKGTRDFPPQVMVKRNVIFSTIRKTFERFGYQPLETPAMENIETLTGKYGDEGDQLLFKILNSRQYDAKNKLELLDEYEKSLRQNTNSPMLTERALRYDLTVPFARFVVMNKNEIVFPFKRYQIQNVWRADRPQKGRYREFYQCDADVIGSDSLLNEVELVQIFDEVLSALEIPAVIQLNNRKLLAGIAEVAGLSDRMMEMTISIDKLEKVGEEGVVKELRERNFNDEAIEKISALFVLKGSNAEKLSYMQTLLDNSETGKKGIEELRFIFDYVSKLGLRTAELEFDITLARGLNYYTGAIFEVKAKNVQMGSICGGGRYDNLTGIFGLPGISGVGISFGADRIYDVMTELNLFGESTMGNTQLLFVNFGTSEEEHCMKLLQEVRRAGINAELYPEGAKMKKQMKYADDKSIPFVALVGSKEMEDGTVTLKDMKSGEQETLTTAQLYSKLSTA